ncbi:MAG: biotin/lipoate--protein ligase family protein [Hyphomicrobiaceae bacterium]
MLVEDPRLPPLLTGHGVKAPLRPFDEACRAAAEGRLGAADLVYARHTSRVDLALILEPDVVRSNALQMVPLFVLAAIEGVGALMPPQTSVLWRWPERLAVNGAEAGRFSFAMAPADQDEAPAWMVLGIDIDLMERSAGHEPGHTPHRTTLQVEGAGETSRSQFIETIAAYALTWINRWTEAGFGPVHGALVGRIEGHGDEPSEFTSSGDRLRGSVLGIDDEMRLLVKLAQGGIRALPIEEYVTSGPHGDAGVRCAP